MRVRFEEEEYFVMAMFEKDTRTGTMEEIRRVLQILSRRTKNNPKMGRCLHLSTVR